MKPVHATAATAPATTSEPTPSTSPTNPTVPELTLSGANEGRAQMSQRLVKTKSWS